MNAPAPPDPDDDGPEPCELCDALASYFVTLEHVIDDYESEEGAIFLCGAHYALHVGTPIGVCAFAASIKPDDDDPPGSIVVDVTTEPEPSSDVGRWVLCAHHGAGVWALLEQKLERE